MRLFAFVAVALCWGAWLWPFVFRAPHGRKVAKRITLTGTTAVGLALECAGIAVAVLFREEAGAVRLVAAVLVALLGPLLSWPAVRHLGKQFRVRAGLFEDHELVSTGPYGIVRHPIYASVGVMMLSCLLLMTPWQWWPVSLVLFVAGTEIRVRAEDRLLRSAFPEAFEEYRRRVPAYIPFIR